jgi:hypothetical protein
MVGFSFLKTGVVFVGFEQSNCSIDTMIVYIIKEAIAILSCRIVFLLFSGAAACCKPQLFFSCLYLPLLDKALSILYNG